MKLGTHGVPSIEKIPVFIPLFLICFCKGDDCLRPHKTTLPGRQAHLKRWLCSWLLLLADKSTADSYIGIWYHNNPERQYSYIGLLTRWNLLVVFVKIFTSVFPAHPVFAFSYQW
jgi:hypothetical protein